LNPGRNLRVQYWRSHLGRSPGVAGRRLGARHLLLHLSQDCRRELPGLLRRGRNYQFRPATGTGEVSPAGGNLHLDLLLTRWTNEFDFFHSAVKVIHTDNKPPLDLCQSLCRFTPSVNRMGFRTGSPVPSRFLCTYVDKPPPGIRAWIPCSNTNREPTPTDTHRSVNSDHKRTVAASQQHHESGGGPQHASLGRIVTEPFGLWLSWRVAPRLRRKPRAGGIKLVNLIAGLIIGSAGMALGI